LVNTTLFQFVAPVINTRQYKITLSGRQQSTDAGLYLLNINTINFCSWNPTGDTDLSRVFIYTATSTGNITIDFIGSGTVSPNNDIVQFNLIVEPFM
jgi:hypothetical protein